MRGRKKLPTKLHMLNGDPSKHGVNKLQEKLDREPQPKAGVPRMPYDLTPGARRMWKVLVPELDRLGLLTIVDAGALEAACVAYGRASQADAILSKEGLTYNVLEKVERDGEIELVVVDQKTRHEVAISDKAWKQFRAFCVEFGLTPASRARLSTPGGKTDDLAEILSRPRLDAERVPAGIQ